MGVSPLAATFATLPYRTRLGRYWWPTLPWRSSALYTQQYALNTLSASNSFRSTAPRFSSQSRATSRRSADRASEGIQRAPLSRIRFSPEITLRRWMLPTVERGPPFF